jgi:16S rRNA (guanine527-N7)-methyltransferase
VDRPREPLPTRVEDTPQLPTEYADALEAGLDAISLALSPVARAAIDGHVRLLLAWTEAINLTGIREPSAVATAHVVDSLSGASVLRERGVDRFIDLGSGGGFPGLPIAAVLPAARALLLEPVAKKAGFLSVVAAATGLAATVEAAPVRAEALAADGRHRGRWPGVTVRAVASTPELVELAFPLLEPGGCLVAWKRGDLDAELAAAERAIDALGGGTIEVRPVAVDGLDGHRLVVATSRGRVPPGYPRDPGARKRRPW